MVRNRIETTCEHCGKTIYVIPSRYNRTNHHFCCKKCFDEHPRQLRVETTKDIYRTTKRRGERRLYHRAVMENALGRKLGRYEFVHHINGDKQDNRIENLTIMTPQEHNDLHKTKHPKTKICAICGKEFTPPVKHRARNTICSDECMKEWYRQNGIKERKPIKQYDLYGNYIQTFESIRAATREVDGQATNIVKALKGKINSAYGYKWEYAV